MSNLFRKTSSNWARYDKYEWKEDKEGTLYITPSPDRPNSVFCSGKCKNQYNVYKSRAKYKDNNN